MKGAEGKVVPFHAVNAYGRVEVELHSFLTSVINGGYCKEESQLDATETVY